MPIAITREVSPALAACQLSFIERAAIDIERARVQHQHYRQALLHLGCELIDLPALADFPDSVFVEDSAVVVDEVAVLTRPGAPSRRGEVEHLAATLAHYRPLRRIEAPGTLDGGDVLRLGRHVFVGLSARSNAAGIDQLAQHLAEFSYRVQGVATRDCLHLKSAVTAIADDAVLLQPAWVDRAVFADYRIVEVDPDEAHAANVVRLGEALLMPAGFPRTQARLQAQGIAVTTVDLSELQKAEGACTCCSILL